MYVWLCRGFFFAHMGWLMLRRHPDVKLKGNTIDFSDLEADEIIMFQKRWVRILSYFIHCSTYWTCPIDYLETTGGWCHSSLLHCPRFWRTMCWAKRWPLHGMLAFSVISTSCMSPGAWTVLPTMLVAKPMTSMLMLTGMIYRFGNDLIYFQEHRSIQ